MDTVQSETFESFTVFKKGFLFFLIKLIEYLQFFPPALYCSAEISEVTIAFTKKTINQFNLNKEFRKVLQRIYYYAALRFIWLKGKSVNTQLAE